MKNTDPGQIVDLENQDFNYEGYFSAKNSFKDIALNHFKKCIEEGSKEMTHGGIIERVIEGKVVQVAVPDQVEVYANSVKMLVMTLAPYMTLKEHAHYLPKVKELERDLKELKAELNRMTERVFKQVDGVEPTKRQDSRQVNSAISILRRENEMFLLMSNLLGDLNWFDEVTM
jgi:predicted RNase H-like nuclease (RuvC/YqgF family)